MEHKAFLFDTAKYHAEIEKIIEKCCESKAGSLAERYINEHLEQFSSPYTYEPLEQGWEQDEIFDAYDDLCGIYEQAEKQGKGILFTF